MRRTWDVARSALRPATAREIRGLAAAAVLYPFGISEAANTGLLRLMAGERPPAPRTIRTPVVLVHGYGGNRSNWLPLQDQLACAGFTELHAMLYNPILSDLPRIAERLVVACEDAMREAGSDRVHVVGHSLGGIVLRYAVARLGLGAHLDLAITIASPHAGTGVARLGRGPVAVGLRPGSALLREVADAACPDRVRWICYWSNGDYLVSPASACLSARDVRATNVPVPEEGHLSILRSPVLLSDVVERLVDAEDTCARTRSAGTMAA